MSGACAPANRPRPPAAASPALLASATRSAALLLAADLLVVLRSRCCCRYVLDAPIEWADDVARGLMVALELLRRGERAGARRECRRRVLRRQSAGRDRAAWSMPSAALLVLVDRGLSSAFNAIALGLVHHRADHRLRPAAGTDLLSDGRGAVCMTIFALRPFCGRAACATSSLAVVVVGVVIAGLWLAWACCAPDTVPPSGAPMLVGLRRLPVRRRADRLCAGVGGADLHLGRRHAARRDLRPADGARHRQFRAAGDPVLHPGRLSHGGERHVRSPDRAAAARWSAACAAGSTS